MESEHIIFLASYQNVSNNHAATFSVVASLATCITQLTALQCFIRDITTTVTISRWL